MKSLAVMIALGAFVAVAFVPPTQENLQAHAQMLASIESRGVNVAEAADAVQTVVGNAINAVSGLFGSDIVTIEHLTTRVSDAAGTTATELLASAKQEAVSQTKKTVVGHVTGAVRKATGTAQAAPQLRSLLTAGELAVFGSQVQMIESAVKNGNVRACRDIVDVQTGDDAVSVPSATDFMVLCIAMVTGDPNRCVQIDEASSSPPLHSICQRQTTL